MEFPWLDDWFVKLNYHCFGWFGTGVGRKSVAFDADSNLVSGILYLLVICFLLF